MKGYNTNFMAFYPYNTSCMNEVLNYFLASCSCFEIFQFNYPPYLCNFILLDFIPMSFTKLSI